MTWLPELLEHFESQPLIPPPENFIEKYFERDVKTVQSFVLDELKSKPTDAEAQQAFQKELLSGLTDSKVGLYSTFHDNAIYEFGYNHENAILMAYMGNTLLDASKSGLRLRPGVFEEHKRLFGKSRPSLQEGSKGKGKAGILFQLHDAAWATGDRLLRDFEICSETHSSNYRKLEDKDKTLLKPYQEAKSRAGSSSLPPAVAALFVTELSWIEQHVDEVWAEYQKKILSLGGPPTVHKNFNKPSLTTGASPEEKKERTVKLLPLQTKYAKLPPGRDCYLLGDSACVERIKASYAHSKSELFGFDMAFRVLCSIKAESMPGGAAASARVFDQLKTIPRAAANAMQED
ncbi:RNA-dependent RNA polymerase [Mycena chlorophos]|uniref:RNA-dependent RNA polymerase n=1 Tax=Mycena chlorophos TaxID=658473 RepID=A0A8H6WPK9_MYCCL|nr:RNA-dependent RNA polymerase [Mycena chlorophos]